MGIGRYLLRRLLSSIPTVIGVTVITFALIHTAAGNLVPGVDQLDPRLTAADLARMRHDLGLDQPLWLQYLTWLGGALHGDWGRSLVDGTPVMTLILQRLPNTLELTLTAVALAVALAIPLGVVSALRRATAVDHGLTMLSVAGVSVPAFWLGLILILVFSVAFHQWGLPALPSQGAVSPIDGGDVLDRILHLLMPATVLAFGYLAAWSRYTRSSMLEVLAQDFVRTARAKGMTQRRVLYVHALRNAVIPLATLIGLEFPSIFGGSGIVEIVFSWPGLGRLALERATAFDFNVVFAITTILAVLVVLGNLLADLLYSVLDPRIRLR